MTGKGLIGWLTAVAIAMTAWFGGAAQAEMAHNWQLGMQAAASPVADRFHAFHGGLLVLITVISVFVLCLLLYVIVRFRVSANPTPSRTTHNTMIEVLWTVIPVLILVGVAIPSFRLLYFMDRARDAEMTIKVTGHQWYWSYEYPDFGNFTFDANLVPDKELNGRPRLLATDNKVVVPVDTTIRVLVTSTDVMHSWLVTPVGVQMYATPGRINETWMKVEREGTFYGQCNQICGINHGFMPIEIEAVSKDKFKQWVAEAQKKFAQGESVPPVQVAAATSAQQ